MLDKASDKVGMRTVQELIAVIAGERHWSANRKSWLSDAADKLQNISYRMLKSLFHGEITSEKHWAIIELRETVAIIEAQREREELATLLETLSSRMVVVDENFHGP